jgi:hypothetical protein
MTLPIHSLLLHLGSFMAPPMERRKVVHYLYYYSPKVIIIVDYQSVCYGCLLFLTAQKAGAHGRIKVQSL